MHDIESIKHMNKVRESTGKFAGLKDEYQRDIIIISAVSRLDRWQTANRWVADELKGYVNPDG